MKIGDRNTVGLPILPPDYRGPCRFALDEYGWYAGIVHDHDPRTDWFVVRDTQSGHDHGIPRDCVLRPGEEIARMIQRRGKWEIQCRVVYEAFVAEAGYLKDQYASVYLDTSVDGVEVGRKLLARGPLAIIKSFYDGDLSWVELEEAQRKGLG